MYTCAQHPVARCVGNRMSEREAQTGRQNGRDGEERILNAGRERADV